MPSILKISVSIWLLLILALIAWGEGGIPLLPASVNTSVQNNQINLQSMGQPIPDPFEPAVELTVCPEGPPVCQFKSIQAAIDTAPITDPIESWDKPPKIPLIRVAAGLYTEQLTISKNVWLRGAGRERVTLRPNPLIRQATISIAPLHFGIGIGLQGLTVEGPVHISGIVSGLISDNHFRPAVVPESDPLGGLYLVGALSNLIVLGNTIRGGVHGIVLNAVGPLFGIPGMSGVLGSFESVLIMDNEITENGLKPLALGLGISIRNSTGIRIKRNLIQNNFVGISIIDSQRLGIEENTVGNNRAIGVKDLTSSGVLIKDNLVERQGGNGIQLAGGIYDISKNQIRNNGGRGLILETSASPFFNARVSSLTDNLITANNVDDLKADKETVILQCNGNTIHDYATTEELRKQCEGK